MEGKTGRCEEEVFAYGMACAAVGFAVGMAPEMLPGVGKWFGLRRLRRAAGLLVAEPAGTDGEVVADGIGDHQKEQEADYAMGDAQEVEVVLAAVEARGAVAHG